MKKLLIVLTLLASMSSFAGRYTEAARQAAEMTNIQLSKSANHRNIYEEAAREAALMTDVQINCSRAGQKQIEKLVNKLVDGARTAQLSIPNADIVETEKSVNELKESYAEIFSCEGAIKKAVAGGISESEVAATLDRL